MLCWATPACPPVIVPRACLPPLPQLLLNPTGQDAASYHITRVPACASTTNRYCELHTTAAASMPSLVKVWLDGTCGDCELQKLGMVRDILSSNCCAAGAYCSAQGERLTCVDKTPCHITFQASKSLASGRPLICLAHALCTRDTRLNSSAKQAPACWPNTCPRPSRCCAGPDAAAAPVQRSRV